MYQSVYYDYPTKTYFLRDDKKGWINFQHQQIFYKRVSSQTPNSLPVLTGGWAEPTKQYDKYDPNLLEKDINKEILILRDLYYKNDDEIPSYQNILFLDIETEMGGALTPEYIKSAPMPFTSISIIDKTLKQKICFVIDKTNKIKEVSEQDKIIIPCKDEKDLIYKFLEKWEECDPTIVSTWNGDYFDIPYLYYRISKLLGVEVANKLSPLGKINVQEYGQNSTVKIAGINHLDYMLLFKKYIMKEEPSYKLKDIGPKYAELEKIEFEGNLNQLFEKDIHLFIEYNLRDVEILEELENRLKFIDLSILISHICNIPYESIYFNTVMNEGAILKFLKRLNIVSPNKPTTHNLSRRGNEEKYAGGFIKEPFPGLYFDVMDLDFKSLYPSIIKSLNLSIETLIGRIKTKDNYEQDLSLEKLLERDQNETITVERLDKINYTLESAEISIGQLINIIIKNNYTIAASGAFFRTDIRSTTATILEGWFNKREHYRELKKKAGKEKDWEKYKLFDNFQMAFKILQNALYGTYAKNAWRYTDGYTICSAAITNTGQRLTQESINFINNKINLELGQDKDYVCISDTDSMYIQIGDLLKSRYSSLENKDEKILKISTELENEANFYLNELCIKLFNIPKGKHFFELKQEVIVQSLIVTGKRRYAMFISNKEGVAIPKDHKDALDLKGLELMKSNMNKKFRTFGENLIKQILFGASKEEIDVLIINFYKELKTLDIKELAKPTGVQYISSYIKRTAKSGEIFSETKLGAPSNTKAAVRYNDLLKFKKLDKKFESIVEQDKIYIVNLKPNPYNIETIGIPNNKIPDDIYQFIKDYVDIESIFESILLNKLKGFYEDLGWTFPNLNSKINKFLKF